MNVNRHFTLGKQLGRGSFGEVYEIKEQEDVCVKKIDAFVDFFRELAKKECEISKKAYKGCGVEVSWQVKRCKQASTFYLFIPKFSGVNLYHFINETEQHSNLMKSEHQMNIIVGKMIQQLCDTHEQKQIIHAGL